MSQAKALTAALKAYVCRDWEVAGSQDFRRSAAIRASISTPLATEIQRRMRCFVFGTQVIRQDRADGKGGRPLSSLYFPFREWSLSLSLVLLILASTIPLFIVT